MLRELEDILTKWSICLLTIGSVLSVLYVFTGVLYGVIQKRSIFLIFAISGALLSVKFYPFRTHSNDLELFIRDIADAELSRVRTKNLIGITWLVLIALPFGVLGLKLTGIADGTNFYDFGAYYNAAERVIHDYPLYDWTSSYPGVTTLPESPDRYLYAPLVSVLFVPFGLLPFETAALAWSTLSIIVYLAGITVLIKSLTTSLSRREWAIIYTASLGFGPFVITFIAGQVTGILAGILCFVAARYHNHKGREALSSILTTVPVVFKAYYAPAGAPLLRDRRRLLSALASGTSIILIGVLIFGPQTTIEYLKVLAGGKGWGSAIDPPTTWNINNFHPFYYLDNTGYIIRVLFLATIATVAYRSRHYELEYMDLYMYSFGLLGIVLGAPVISTSGLIVTVPVILFLLMTTIHDQPGVFVGTLGATILIHIHPYTNEFLSSILFPALDVDRLAGVIIPVVQPAVWGVFLLLICLIYEYTRRLSGEST